MSFSIQIATDLIALDAGVSTPLSVQIINRGEQPDRLEMEVEGLDPEWTAVPVPLFTVGASESQTEKVFFSPPRVSESLAGNYPFVIKVRSLNSGDARSVQGVLQIKPYNHISMEILPKKGVVSPVRVQEVFHATIMNLGNSEHTLQLYGSDPEDAFVFEFEQEQVTISPGQQKEVEVRVTPTKSRPFANPRLHVFTISARSVGNPSVVCSSQAQIEQKPLVTPGVMGVVAIIVLLLFAWFRFKPQPAVMDFLTVNPPEALVGSTMTVKWKASNAKSVELKINDQDLTVESEGSRDFTATQSGAVEATAMGDHGQASRPAITQFTVKQPAVVPDPKITAFDISPREVPTGQPLLVHYTVNDATTKVTLAPLNQVLDPKIDSVKVNAEDKPGVYKYTLYAENSKGKTVQKTVSVKVIQTSSASVVFFDVQPRSLDVLGGKVKVSWQLSDAAKAQLSVNGQMIDLASTSGETEMDVQKTTDFMLLGYDTKGIVKRSNKITVEVKAPPEPTPTTTTTNSGATTAGTPTTTTGGTKLPMTTGGR